MSISSTVLASRMLVRTRMRHLHVFLKVAELGSVKRAAEVVGMTQPSASHVITELENLLGCNLFLRHARGVTLTRSGHALLPFVRRMLDLVYESADVVAAFQNSANRQIRIASISSGIMGILSNVLPDFSQAYPKLLVQVQEMNLEEVGIAVSQAHVDLVLCRQPEALPNGWEFKILMPDRFVVVAGHQHPLAKKGRVDISDLWLETWLQGPTASAARRVFDEMVAHHGVEPRQRLISTRSPFILWAMLSKERLISLMPASFVAQMLGSGQICQLVVDIDIPYTPLGIMYPLQGEGEASLLLREFLEVWSKARG